MDYRDLICQSSVVLPVPAFAHSTRPFILTSPHQTPFRPTSTRSPRPHLFSSAQISHSHKQHSRSCIPRLGRRPYGLRQVSDRRGGHHPGAVMHILVGPNLVPSYRPSRVSSPPRPVPPTYPGRTLPTPMPTSHPRIAHSLPGSILSPSSGGGSGGRESSPTFRLLGPVLSSMREPSCGRADPDAKCTRARARVSARPLLSLSLHTASGCESAAADTVSHRQTRPPCTWATHRVPPISRLEARRCALRVCSVR